MNPLPVFRPSPGNEIDISKRARAHLFARFSSGEYRGKEAANEVIQHQFVFYERILKSIVPNLASRTAVDFLLSQYDVAADHAHGHGIHDPAGRFNWSRVEPAYTRAVKYLVELMCAQTVLHDKRGIGLSQKKSMEIAIICAECMADLIESSGLAHSIFPVDYVATVGTKRDNDFLHLGVEGIHEGYGERWMARVIRDRSAREKFVKMPQFDLHPDLHAPFLNPAFEASFGLPYTEFVTILHQIIEGCQPAPGETSALFVRRAVIVEEYVSRGFNASTISTILDGFTIRPETMLAEKRVMWKPKQEYRASRRGFFEFPHSTGKHLAFSRGMAQQCWIQMVHRAAFKRIPTEWRTEPIALALAKLSNAASDWFESKVIENLGSLGIKGQRFVRAVHRGQTKLQIPDVVGELDFLGFLPERKMLILTEAKLVLSGLEAQYWRDDIDEFVNRPKSYAEKFRQKIDWVSSNRIQIANALDLPTISEVGFAMVTLYPCIAREFLNDFQCVSLPELMLDFQEKATWPYPTI